MVVLATKYFLYYRFTVCPLESSDDNEQWCFNINDDYPDTLLAVPFAPSEDTTMKPVGHSVAISASIALVLYASIVLYL